MNSEMAYCKQPRTCDKFGRAGQRQQLVKPVLYCTITWMIRRKIFLLHVRRPPYGVFHLPRNSGNSGWDVNGTHVFGSFHWKISGINGTSEKVVLFSR